jgi:hypothetical protein
MHYLFIVPTNGLNRAEIKLQVTAEAGSHASGGQAH